MYKQLVEKDCYVTKVLRIISACLEDKNVPKAGVNPSKGWNIIQRFSEDVDVFVNTHRFDPPLRTVTTQRGLVALKNAVVQHPQLTVICESKFKGQRVHACQFAHIPCKNTRIPTCPDVPLEIETRSSKYPTEVVFISSSGAEFLHTVAAENVADNLSVFPMTLLHFHRTFVNKPLAVHCAVESYPEYGNPPGVLIRHYCDLYTLLATKEFHQTIELDEFQQLKEDSQHGITQQHFSSQVRYLPEDLRFSNSQTLFPSAEPAKALAHEYISLHSKLCFSHFPSFEQLTEAFEEVRDIL